MKISNINPHINFGGIRKSTAGKLFKNAFSVDEINELKKLVVLSEDKAKDYIVYFNPESNCYDVQLENNFWAKNKALRKQEGFADIKSAVYASIEMQNALSEYKLENATTMLTKDVIKHLTKNV